MKPVSHHLLWIMRFQFILALVGAGLWLYRGWNASLSFCIGATTSIAFWKLHIWTLSRILDPEVKRRWIYALLFMLKLALIAGLLHVMMGCFPQEGLPLVSGILLFIAAIMLEALRLTFRPENPESE